MTRFRLFLPVCLCLSAWGCGLIPAPYATNVTGPVHGVRVLDLGNGQDILNASATLETGPRMTNVQGPMPPQLFAATAEAIGEAGQPRGQKLNPRKDQGFDVPTCVTLGIATLGSARANPPVAILAVSAPGYVHATLEYCAAEPPQPGWSESRSLPQEWTVPRDETTGGTPNPPDADGNQELVRCEFHEDGIVKFYLRRLEPASQ